MLTRPLSHFVSLVWESAGRLGRNAPLVADDVLQRAFPRTYPEALHEGALKLLRRGAIDAIRNILKKGEDDETTDDDDAPSTRDFWQDDPVYAPIAGRLKSRRYWVEQEVEYRSIDELIADPSDLNQARKLMRQKGDECLREADILDELYEAVVARGR